MYQDPAVREAIPGLMIDLLLRPRATPGFGDAVTSGTARAGISADTIMEVIAGSAWYAVCVRRIKDVDSAAKELTELVLRGVLATLRIAAANRKIVWGLRPQVTPCSRADSTDLICDDDTSGPACLMARPRRGLQE